MTVKDNKAAVLRLYTDCFNQGDLAVADALVAPDYRDLSPDVPTDGPATGADTLKRRIVLWRTAFPDLQGTVEEMIAAGTAVTVRVTWTGTQEGEFLGIPPTGQGVSWAAVEVFHLRTGRVVRRYGLHDGVSLMHQLGALAPRQGGVVARGQQALDQVKGALGQVLDTATGAAQDVLGTVKARLGDVTVSSTPEEDRALGEAHPQTGQRHETGTPEGR